MKKAKPISECEWEVEIERLYTGSRYFRASTMDNCLTDSSLSGIICKTNLIAKNLWIKFAKLNGITKYKFVE
jgi:hypothetical protein